MYVKKVYIFPKGLWVSVGQLAAKLQAVKVGSVKKNSIRIIDINFPSQSDPIYYTKWALVILNRAALY